MMIIGILLFFIGIILQGIARYKAIKGHYFESLWKPWKGMFSFL